MTLHGVAPEAGWRMILGMAGRTLLTRRPLFTLLPVNVDPDLHAKYDLLSTRSTFDVSTFSAIYFQNIHIHNIHIHIYIHINIYIQKDIPCMGPGPGPCTVYLLVCICLYVCIYVYVYYVYVYCDLLSARSTFNESTFNGVSVFIAPWPRSRPLTTLPLSPPGVTKSTVTRPWPWRKTILQKSLPMFIEILWFYNSWACLNISPRA